MSGSHANPLAVKTDAPPGVVWDVVRCWVRKTGASAAALKDPDSYSAKILAKEVRTRRGDAGKANMEGGRGLGQGRE